MEFQINHDYHIHSGLSSCSSDPEQTGENILKAVQKHGIKELCLTDHFWDSDVEGASNWYKPQNYEHIASALPLPQGEDTRFYFGCETDMDRNFKLGIAPDKYDKFDFIIVPTTHLHMSIAIDKDKVPSDDIKTRSEIYVERFGALLDMDLPFEKVGVAHLTCPLIAKGEWAWHIEVINRISDSSFNELFTRAAKVGIGIEINLPFDKYAPDELDEIMRPYVIAKKCGCKFYIGSDAHHIESFEDVYSSRKNAVKYLGLTEDDRFRIERR